MCTLAAESAAAAPSSSFDRLANLGPSRSSEKLIPGANLIHAACVWRSEARAVAGGTAAPVPRRDRSHPRVRLAPLRTRKHRLEPPLVQLAVQKSLRQAGIRRTV